MKFCFTSTASAPVIPARTASPTDRGTRCGVYSAASRQAQDSNTRGAAISSPSTSCALSIGDVINAAVTAADQRAPRRPPTVAPHQPADATAKTTNAQPSQRNGSMPPKALAILNTASRTGGRSTNRPPYEKGPPVCQWDATTR